MYRILKLNRTKSKFKIVKRTNGLVIMELVNNKYKIIKK